MVQRENLMVHVVSTATIATAGFVIGSLLGAAMGYMLGMSVLIENVLSPYHPRPADRAQGRVRAAVHHVARLQRSGRSSWSRVLVVFFPILVNVLQSMKTVDRDLINLARAYSMTALQIFWKIEFPASMPALMAGLRIGATLAVIGVTVGELVGGNTGLGYLITFGEGQANTAMVFNAIVLLTLVGIVLYGAVTMIEARVLHYIPRAHVADDIRKEDSHGRTSPCIPRSGPKSSSIPKGKSLGDWLDTRIARYETRELDWDALKFQADFDPKYRRAQMRYIGTGGTGVAKDDNAVPAEHFTFSTMVLPAGCEGPLHLHTDVEEVFFVLRGNKVRFIIEHQGERFETVLKERDLFSVPPGVYRGLVNEGIEEALMCVMIGNAKPVTPTYPPDHPVAKIKRPKRVRRLKAVRVMTPEGRRCEA